MPDSGLTMEERFFQWLSPQTPPSQLSTLHDAYREIDAYFQKKRVLQCALFDTTDLSRLAAVKEIIEGDRMFRFFHKRKLNVLSAAIRFYIVYVKTNGQKKANPAFRPAPAQTPPPVNSVQEKAVSQAETTSGDGMAREIPSNQRPVATDKSPEALPAFKTETFSEEMKRLNPPEVQSAVSSGNAADVDQAKEPQFLPQTLASDLPDSMDEEKAEEANPVRQTFDSSEELPQNSGLSMTPKDEKEAAQNKAAFQDWLMAQGIDFSTAYAYCSALKQCGDFANSQGLLKQDVFTVSNPNAVKTLMTRIRANPTLAGRLPREAKKYLSALRKFMQFRMGRPAVSETSKKEATLSTIPAQTFSEQSPVSVSVTPPPEQNPVPVSVTPPPEQSPVSATPAEETERYQTILREEFPDGFRQNYAIHAKKFIRRYAERYGTEPEIERDEIIRRLSQIGYALDGRIYAKGDAYQTELLEKIHAAIHDAFQDGASCVFVSMLYQRYQQELAEQLRVYSADTLLSLLTAHENWEYYERDGHLFNKSNFVDFSRHINDLPDVLRVMKNSYKPMNYQELQARLWYLPLENIKSALVRAADVVSVDTETYFYAPHFPISQAELETLSRAMGREIERRGFLTARNLRELLERNCPSAAVDAASFKDYGFRNALSVLLRDRFTFNGAIVSEQGHKLTLHEVWRDYCRSSDRLTLAALKELAEEVNSTIYWDDVFREMVRVSENEFVNRKRIRFSAPDADAALETLCPGDYIPIQDISLWAHFPPLEVPWNGYVLESYLLRDSVKFRLERVSASESGFYGVIVRNGSAFQNYEAVITDMLAHSWEWTDEKTALEWIVDRGCQARKRLTNFGKILREAQLLREKLETETG